MWSGADTGWRYLAYRISGDGQQGQLLADDLPLSGVQVTDVLSGPCTLTGTINPTFLRMKVGGRPLLDERSTVIWAEQDGQIRGGGIYQSGSFDGPQWSLTCAGFASYPQQMGWCGDPETLVQADPLDIVRLCWANIQSGLDSNLGLNVDASTTTRVRLGQPATDGSSSSDGPYELNEWSTDNLGQVIDDLAKATPFDYRERHFWNQRRDTVLHELDFGYPTLGGRRKDLRFVFGENIQSVPTVTRDGSTFANHVRFLGAGEGSEMVRREARARDGRLRTMVTIDDKSITGGEHAQRRARQELTARQLLPTVDRIVCWDTPQAPLGSWTPGDEILVQGEVDWLDVYQWSRVTSIVVSPDNPEILGMSLVRADAV